jgi:transposase-like protein
MDNLSPVSQPHLRQSYTAAQKIQIVKQSMMPNVSIASVAMAHRINANQLHRWRWMYRNDQLGSRADRLELGSVTGFLPVQLAPKSRTPKPAPKPAHTPALLAHAQTAGHIELFVGEHRICIHGDVQVNNLLAVLAAIGFTSNSATPHP